MAELKEICVRGAREHNLKSVDLDIPRNRLIVFTGLSGSGKSSLAIDTIYAEGQRRYVESLSVYARQFLHTMEKPAVDNITGLSPAISIEQKTTSRNPRSTVGTVTEIHDYLRLLFAKAGTPYSPETGLPIQAQQVSDMVDRIMGLDHGTRIYLLAPVVRDRKGAFQNELREFRRQGFLRVRIDGSPYTLDEVPSLEKKNRHNIDIVVDRLVIEGGIEERLADSLRTALDNANGIAVVELLGSSEDDSKIILSENFACPVSGFTIPEIEPRIFSFNAHAGACAGCGGLGTESYFDEARIVPDHSVTLADYAIAPWRRTHGNFYLLTMQALAKHYGANIDVPWKKQPQSFRQVLLHGSKGEKIEFDLTSKGYGRRVRRTFEGVIPNLERRYRETNSAYVREELERFRDSRQCTACGGYRLKRESLAVKLGGLHIGEVADMSIEEALKFTRNVPKSLSRQNNKIAESILKEISQRLQFLINVGLDYLTLSRRAGTLSGGESQRIRLASQIGAGLTGVLYVLDEPSIGLHQRDNKRLLTTLKNLRDQGNTVIVVEHDEEAIREADFVVDMGPGAGVHGGSIVKTGTADDIISCSESITGQYLGGVRCIEVPGQRREGSGHSIQISGAKANNLRDVDAAFPLGRFICVTGVSGSGKSSLTFETLYPSLVRSLAVRLASPVNCKSISGLENVDKVIHIDQRPIGRTPRSNPATYTKAFDGIRDWYANLPESRERGYPVGRFSFNVKGGRCEACSGDGVLKISMHFLPDVYVTCESCKGTRYNRETLEVMYREKNISDILNMTIEEAEQFFRAIPHVRDKLTALRRVGLGYLKVGQPAPMLSGGEAQRVKLAKELSRRSTGKTLYLLDEPTTGLHFEDIKNLLAVLHEFVELGNTVIVIEHNLDVIKTADWIIDMGPEGGDKGGQIIYSGTPESVVSSETSFTGQFLAEIMVPSNAQAA